MLVDFKNIFKKFRDRPAFCIDDTYYTYGEFSTAITGIQKKLFDSGFQDHDIALIFLNDDLETYAAIFAVWLSCGTIVPINPNHPEERKNQLISQSEYSFALGSKKNLESIDRNKQIDTKTISRSSDDFQTPSNLENRILYVIFTSGSTGKPKGVPIDLENLQSYLTENIKLYPNLNEQSKCLQIYDLTFDASIQSYVLPLMIGACVYHVSSKKIKYLEAYRIMKTYGITFIKMTNSVLRYLKPYFPKIKLPMVEYSLFGGEGLEIDLIREWQKCCPNAVIHNVYGPTEATVNTHYFHIKDPVQETDIKNGILSIGKTFGSNHSLVVDGDLNELPKLETGELCLGGNQITNGYWTDDDKNKDSFFIASNRRRYYRTGDLGYLNNDGNFIFIGRKDNQVKIDGYRVDLLEVEQVAKKSNLANNFVAICDKNGNGFNEIFLFGEKLKVSGTEVIDYLKKHLPSYMIPVHVISIDVIPLTTTSKIDRQFLASKLYD